MNEPWQAAISARETLHDVDHSTRTASWISWSIDDTTQRYVYKRRGAYAAVCTLSNLARSSDSFLWLLYAPIITAWKGCTGDLKTRRANLAEHLDKHCQSEYTAKLTKIRLMLSQTQIRSISSPFIPDFVHTIHEKNDTKYEELCVLMEDAYATTPRQGPITNTILFSAETQLFTEMDILQHLDGLHQLEALAALPLGIVYTTVHESMHLVGNLVCIHFQRHIN